MTTGEADDEDIEVDDRNGPDEELPDPEQTWPVEGEQGEGIGWVLREGTHLSVALRSSRRRLRWNQRDLARRAGLHQATIARMEAGTDVRFSAVLSALSACGLLLVAAPPVGAPADWRVVPHPMDEGRDTGGRRLPAHLPAYPTAIIPDYTLWKRMVRGENLLAERPPHWLYAREPWPVPPEPPPDPATRPPEPGS
jgi:transcriptional regulator with XRE-family HTH domain